MSQLLKYVFLGTPPIAATILRRLVEVKGPPALVVTQEAKQAGRGHRVTRTAVEELARELGLSLLQTSQVNADDVLQRLKLLKPDLLLVVAFGQIFREPLLAIPSRYCLNVHTSLLPKYRGAAPVHRAVMNGEVLTGVTIQKMVKKLDAGDILVQKSLAIAPEDTTETLLEKLAPLGAEALIEAVGLIEIGAERFTPQDETAVSIAAKIEKHHGVIDWSCPADSIRNQVRALQPWPVAETKLGVETLKIFRCRVVPGLGAAPPGTIDTDGKARLVVQCGKASGEAASALHLEEVQLQNRKRLTISQFLAGYRGQFPFQSF